MIRKLAGNLSPDEEDYLDRHLAECAACASVGQDLGKIWQRFGSLPEPQIPAKLEKKARETTLGYLKWERALSPLVSIISEWGIWSFSIPLLAGLLMTWISYSLVGDATGAGVHHHYVLFSLYGLWWLLFAVFFWLLLRMSDHSVSQINLVSGQSILVALLTLIITFLAFEIELFSQPRMYTAGKLAAATQDLFGIGNIFVTSWWIHCCLASFIGGLVFCIGRFPLEPGYVFVGALIATVLLLPAIFLQGFSHNHGYGVIAFTALGTYAGELVGMASGLFIGHRLSFQVA